MSRKATLGVALRGRKKLLKRFKTIKKENLKNLWITALCTRFARIFDFALLSRGAVICKYRTWIQKAKATMASLRSVVFYTRFARSRCEFQHGNVNFLGFKSLKSGFSEGLGATFCCDARRHSLRKYFDRLDILN